MKLVKRPSYKQKLKSGGQIQKYQLGRTMLNIASQFLDTQEDNLAKRVFKSTINSILKQPSKNKVPNKINIASKTSDPTSDYNSLRASYLEALENPDRIGYDAARDRWTSPTQKGYDANQIGIGLDKNTNNDVRQFLAKNHRDWLTNQEMPDLQSKSLQYFENVLDRNTKGTKLSNIKRAAAIGLLYHGYGPKLWNKTHALSKALFEGSDQDFINAITKFYGTNTRAVRHSQFWKKLFGN